ncbi:MCD, Malonyl-CoA decarboxylase MCD [Phreatobacter aquaticus]|uniref:MCD, Malonyl-CoA decarboxylase MCD n=1 Tax=Phreatobacter aquaticus TaxID=2570229 RepID=A0A4D7QDV2_9HYPH|nr:malonyl-CoA decarboxylase [Phreatobacter aquaticus]QCK85388.1 MCD, Malonyl-CoA decarboxylase MCD [Phreatobacter aquaticus]
MTYVADLLATVSRRSRELIGWPEADTRPRKAADLSLLADALLSRRGEASGVALARDILTGYEALDADGRTEVLLAIADRLGPDRKRLADAIEAYSADPTEARAAALHVAAEPRRQELVRRLNLAPRGTLSLVRLREDVLARLDDHPGLKVLDTDLVHLFSSWFNRGFLVVRRIDWSTPANILEKIIRYEAVHEIRDWDELRRRLEPEDRRCYAFFHPQLEDEPLIFVEVALTAEIPAAIGPLIAEGGTPMPADDARVAVFYSISNCQNGLAGISFGSFLIKQVVEELKRELPKLTTFVTLSPVPRFAAWLAKERATETGALTSEERGALAALDKPDWRESPARVEKLDRLLARLAARYFLTAKGTGNRPLDPVARFHLGNGARLERINAGADLSASGLAQSHGVMVNYLYDLGRIEENHEAYAERRQVVTSSAVKKLADAKA